MTLLLLLLSLLLLLPLQLPCQMLLKPKLAFSNVATAEGIGRLHFSLLLLLPDGAKLKERESYQVLHDGEIAASLDWLQPGEHGQGLILQQYNLAQLNQSFDHHACMHALNKDGQDRNRFNQGHASLQMIFSRSSEAVLLYISYCNTLDIDIGGRAEGGHWNCSQTFRPKCMCHPRSARAESQQMTWAWQRGNICPQVSWIIALQDNA